MSNNPVYMRWHDMIRRCTKPRHHAYKYYGLRGINVCEGWRNFRVYNSDTENKPDSAHSIDRINNDKGYWCGHCLECIENCWDKNWRWATRSQQGLNRRRFKHKRTPDHEMKGVRKRGNRFQSQATIDGKKYYLGTFHTAVEAHNAYLKAVSNKEETP